MCWRAPAARWRPTVQAWWPSTVLSHLRWSPGFFLAYLHCCPKLYSDPVRRVAADRIVCSEREPLVASLHHQPAIPRDVVESALHRLGDWESNVDRPRWSVPNQQLELPPSNRSAFTIHIDAPEQVLRFQGCQEERQFWLDSLHLIEPDVLKIARFRQCGKYAWVNEDVQTGELFLQGACCKLRICPACRRRIQWKAKARVLDFLNQHDDLKWQFHTFTLKHSQTPLPQQLDRLVKCFRRLRQRMHWKRTVSMGYAVLEVTFHHAGTWSPNGRRREYDEWHPHLHAVVATEWTSWSLLHKSWLEITGDSHDVDCEKVRNNEKAAYYVGKYIGKPPDLNLDGNLQRMTEYYRSLQGRRMLMPFGATAKHRLPAPEPRMGSIQVCRFSALLTAAAAGDYCAQSMLARIIIGTVPRRVVEQQRQRLLRDRGPP